MVTALNAAAVLLLESRKEIKIGSINRVHSDGRRDIFVSAEPGVMHLRAFIPSVHIERADGSVESYHAADPAPGWLEVAQSDPAVASALRMLASATLDWVNLYRIYEVVAKDSAGDTGIANRGWATLSQLRLFKQTANSPAVAGLEARHGVQTNMPPAKPMSVESARHLINDIVTRWLNSK